MNRFGAILTTHHWLCWFGIPWVNLFIQLIVEPCIISIMTTLFSICWHYVGIISHHNIAYQATWAKTLRAEKNASG